MATRNIHPFPREYRGILIWPRNYAGMYSARMEDGTPLAADTLAGMRNLIRHHLTH